MHWRACRALAPSVNDSHDYQSTLDALPPSLRALLDAELAAGNAVAEVGHGHPAPPVGAYVLLQRRVSTRARASADGLDFYERNNSHHSGEFTEGKRFFFILEPPHPPEAEPDMDAIRDGIEARQRDADRQRQAAIEGAIEKERVEWRSMHTEAHGHGTRAFGLVTRFLASMQLDYERWKEGAGYDLALIEQATPEERAEIETTLVMRGVRDWRDVEALAALDTPPARAVLRETLAHGSREHAVAVLQHAPHLLTDDERTQILVAALEETSFFQGLTQTLSEVERFHPPAVIDALLRGVLGREGEVAVHFVAMLLFIRGQASSPFDWDQRSYCLRFNTPAGAQREALFRQLCARIGVEEGRH
jgi:hypothetical protein